MRLRSEKRLLKGDRVDHIGSPPACAEITAKTFLEPSLANTI